MYFRTALTFAYSLALTWKGWEWRWFLRKVKDKQTSIQKYEMPKNCPFSLPFLTVIAFHRVKKSPLIIGTVDRIKINSEQLDFHSASQSCPTLSSNCKNNYVCFVYFAAIAQVWINLHRQNVLQWCYEMGAKSHRKRTKKKPWRKRQSRSWRFSFYKYFRTFFYLFLFFNYFTLSLFFDTFFTHDIYPHPHPRPTPTTHDLYPRPTTHDPRHLATLDLARAKSEALFNIYSFLEENIKSGNTKDRVKTTRTVKNNNNRSN